MGKGLKQEYELSKELTVICGKGPMTRPQITSALWKYIKANNLQDTAPKMGQWIKPDDAMAVIFGKKPFKMFALASGIKTHVTAIED